VSELDALNLALQLAGRRLVEADRARLEANEVALRANKHWHQCYEDIVTLLKGLGEASGERIRNVWLDPEGTVSANGELPLATTHLRVYVAVDGRQVSARKLAEVTRRLAGEQCDVRPTDAASAR
jgi:hypothetical protein